MPPVIDPRLCDGCGICEAACPGDILFVADGPEHMVRYPLECSHCDVCRIECPQNAIEIRFPWNMLQHPLSAGPEG
jgi:adenylylsulfate reductase subunit B